MSGALIKRYVVFLLTCLLEGSRVLKETENPSEASYE